jgi:hypothetical protein
MPLVHDRCMPKWRAVTLEVDGTREDTMAALERVDLAGKRVRVGNVDHGSVTIEDWWHPAWGVRNAVLRFPFGLLSVFYRRHTHLLVIVGLTADGRTEVHLNGDASRNVNGAVWRALGGLLPDSAGAGTIQPATLNRRGEILRAGQRWARANPWPFSIGSGVLLFVLASSLSAWTVWTDVISNAIFAVLVVAWMARPLGLWPNNGVIHWHRSRLPETRW